MTYKLICGDNTSVLSALSDNLIDLTVTSPPYDHLRDYNGYAWDFEGVAKQLYRVTKAGGVVVWVVGDSTISGSESGTSFRQALFFKEIGFKLHDTMIFRKINFIPLTHKRYEQEFEYMFVFVKGKIKTFNPIMRKNKLAGKEYKTSRPRDYDGHAIRHNTNRSLKYNDFSIKGNIFEYIVGSGSDKTNHPATFPEALVHDHIVSWSNAGDLVLDPFVGSGTTCKVANELNRNFIGIDISSEYIHLTERRMGGVNG